VPSLTVVATNIKNRRAAVNWLRRRSRADALEHFDVALVSEAHKRRRELGTLPGHDYLTGPRNGGTGVGGQRLAGNLTQDCGILLARPLPWLGGGPEFLSPSHPPSENIGHERWGYVTITRLGDTTMALVVLHPIPKPTLGAEHRERYVAAMRWLEAEIDKHQALGREVVVGGDLQVREHEKGLHSPRHVFANHDMNWHWRSIDVIAWTPGLEGTKARVIDDFKEETGHYWLRINLAVKPRRDR
jgi:hypothetical protein